MQAWHPVIFTPQPFSSRSLSFLIATTYAVGCQVDSEHWKAKLWYLRNSDVGGGSVVLQRAVSFPCFSPPSLSLTAEECSLTWLRSGPAD